jgi:acetolactate synthase-1/2/3 large subunit
MAAKLIHPERKVVAVCGDGGFMMNSQEIETAIRMKLDLVVVILRDEGYGMIKAKQSEMGMKSFGLNFANPDFVRYARAYGAAGYRARNRNELAQLVRRCLAKKGVHIIDVPMRYKKSL